MGGGGIKLSYFLLQRLCVSPRFVPFAHKTFVLSRKSITFPQETFIFACKNCVIFAKKRCVCLQIVCVLSKKYCIPLRNIVFTLTKYCFAKKLRICSCKSIGFPKETNFVFVSETLAFFTKVLNFANKFHVPLINFMFLLAKVLCFTKENFVFVLTKVLCSTKKCCVPLAYEFCFW